MATPPLGSSRSAVATAFFALSAVYVTTGNYTSNQSFDTVSTALPAWRLATRGDLDLSQFQGWSDWIVPVGDHWVSNRFPGAIGWTTLFYLPVQPATPLIWPATLGAVVATLSAVALMYRVLRLMLGRRPALAGCLVFALATPLWSVAADAAWTHGPAALLLTAAFLAYARSRWLLVGLLLGLCLLVRPHTAIAALILILYAALRTRSARPLLALIGLAIGAAALFGYNARVYGAFGAVGGYDPGHLTASGVGGQFFENVLGALVSPARGLLVYSPILILGLVFGRAAWRRAPDWARGGGVAALGYFAVQLYLVRYSGGSRFYSGRVLIESLVLGWPLFALALDEAVRRGRRWVSGALLAASFGLIGAGAVSNYVPRQEISPDTDFLAGPAIRALSPGTVAGWTIVLTAAVAWWVKLTAQELRQQVDPATPAPTLRHPPGS